MCNPDILHLYTLGIGGDIQIFFLCLVYFPDSQRHDIQILWFDKNNAPLKAVQITYDHIWTTMVLFKGLVITKITRHLNSTFVVTMNLVICLTLQVSIPASKFCLPSLPLIESSPANNNILFHIPADLSTASLVSDRGKGKVFDITGKHKQAKSKSM